MPDTLRSQPPLPPTGGPRSAAIVLAGGASSRMGAPKAALRREGRDLLSYVVEAAAAAGPVVVVAPDALARATLDERARTVVHSVVLEDPPLGGPVAGIAAGVAALPGGVDQVLLLACDLPRAAEAVALLLARGVDAALDDADAVAPVDADGYRQWLAGRYRTAPLRAAVAALGEVRDVSVRRLMAPLRVADLALPPTAVEALADVDTPEQAAAHGLGLPEGP